MSKGHKPVRDLSRRDFLRATTGAAVVGVTTAGASCQRLASAPDKPSPTHAETEGHAEAEGKKGTLRRSKVVLIRDPAVLDEGRQVNTAVLERMLDDAVAALLGKPAAQAWQALLKPDDVLGIKSNVWRFLRTPPQLEQALVTRAKTVGIAAQDIAVDDRGIRGNPVFKRATALINTRPLRTHHWSGVGSCIKNYIMFSAAPFSWHADSCANLAGVWELPECKDKTRLNILVMLTPLFHGKGPHHYQAQYTWEYGGLIVGQDVVAVDATGVRILEAKRRAHFGRDEPMGVPPKHIWVAQERYQLGVADPARIDLIKLGDMKDALI